MRFGTSPVQFPINSSSADPCQLQLRPTMSASSSRAPVTTTKDARRDQVPLRYGSTTCKVSRPRIRSSLKVATSRSTETLSQRRVGRKCSRYMKVSIKSTGLLSAEITRPLAWEDILPVVAIRFFLPSTALRPTRYSSPYIHLRRVHPTEPKLLTSIIYPGTRGGSCYATG